MSRGQVPIRGTPWGVGAPPAPSPQPHTLSKTHSGSLKEQPHLGKDPAGNPGLTAEDGDIVKPEASRAGFSHPGTGRGQGQPHGAEDVVHEPETSCEDPPVLASGITPLGAQGFYKPAQPHSSVMI